MSGNEEESSLLFSLGEIERLERDRVQAERAAAAARRLAAERARIEDEARRASQVEELRAEAERVRREESVRETAMAQAELERVRAEVQVRAQAELDRTQRVHELELAEHRGAIVRGRRRWITAASLVATLASAALAAFLSAELRGAEHALEERSAAFALERDARRRSTDALVATNARIHELETRLDASRAGTHLTEPPAKAPVPKSPGHRTAPRDSTHPRLAPTCTGAEGDPLNGCLR